MNASGVGGFGICGGFLGNAGGAGASTNFEAPDGSFAKTALVGTAGRVVDAIFGQTSGATQIEINGFELVGGQSVAGGGGGGIAASGVDTLIQNCIIRDNVSPSAGGVGFNGFGFAGLTMIRCEVRDNQNDVIAQGFPGGGGIRILNASFTRLANLVISNNHALGNGGGILVSGDILATGMLQASNLAIFDNTAFSGGGVYADSEGPQEWSHLTVAYNEGGFGSGMSIMNSQEGLTTITSSILWDNENEDLWVQSPLDLGWSDIQDTFAFSGTINAMPGIISVDPAFKNPARRNLRLRTVNGGPSPCINAGSPNALADFVDLDGDGDSMEDLSLDLDEDVRQVGAFTDMGAFESSFIGDVGGPQQ